MTYPWEKQTEDAAEMAPETAPEQPSAVVLEALRKDFAYAVRTTAVKVFSNNPAFEAVFNTERGQLVPAGAVKFKDGTTVEMRDIGMCQPGVGFMSVKDIMAEILNVAAQLGLELEQ